MTKGCLTQQFATIAKLLENNHGYALFSTFMSPRYKGEMYMEGKKDLRIREMEEVKEYL